MLLCEIVKSNIQLTIFLATYMRSAIYLTIHIFVNFAKNIVSSWAKVKKDYWLERIFFPSWFQICLKQTYSKLPWAPRNTAKPVALIGTPEGQEGTSHKVGCFFWGGEGKRKQTEKESLKGRNDSRMWLEVRPCVRETFHRGDVPSALALVSPPPPPPPPPDPRARSWGRGWWWGLLGQDCLNPWVPLREALKRQVLQARKGP